MMNLPDGYVLDNGVAADVAVVSLDETEIVLSCDNDQPLLVVDGVYCVDESTGDTGNVWPGEETEEVDETSLMTSVSHAVYVTLTRHCFRKSTCSVLLRDVNDVYEECGSKRLAVRYQCVTGKSLRGLFHLPFKNVSEYAGWLACY